MRKSTKLFAVIGVILLVASIVAGSIPFILPDYDWAGKETYTILSDAPVTEKGNPLQSIAWSPNGRWLATACVDGTVKIMDGTSCLLGSTFHVRYVFSSMNLHFMSNEIFA
jgi:WD40 repeat protein